MTMANETLRLYEPSTLFDTQALLRGSVASKLMARTYPHGVGCFSQR